MHFPEYLDDEDMTLAIKEWTLTGCKISSGTHKGLGFVDVHDPEGEPFMETGGGYMQRKDGAWVLVPHNEYPVWADAQKYAESYDVEAQQER